MHRDAAAITYRDKRIRILSLVNASILCKQSHVYTQLYHAMYTW